MIERLTSTLRALVALSATDLESPHARSLTADCADALRLTLDCPQHDLEPSQRRALDELHELLAADLARAEELHAAIAHACRALGLAPPAAPGRGR